MNQNLNAFAVVSNENIGGMPSVVSMNSITFYEMQMIGYFTLHTGTKKSCTEYHEQLMEQLIEVNFFD